MADVAEVTHNLLWTSLSLFAGTCCLHALMFCVNFSVFSFQNGQLIDNTCVCVSGLKPGQRKVVFCCLKRNDKREVKVAQLAGSVAEMSAYHHGEVN